MKKRNQFKRVVAISLAISIATYGLQVSSNIYGMQGVVKVWAKEKNAFEKVPVMEKYKKDPLTKKKALRATNSQGDYIVVAKDASAYENLKGKLEKSDSINGNGKNKRKQGKLLTVKMSGKEAIQYQKSALTLSVEPDTLVKANSEEQKFVASSVNESSKDWNMQMIHSDALTVNPVQKKVKVAILDSGVDIANDIDVVDSINLIPGEEEVLPLFSDISGHGSSVAGIIAAQENGKGITGINPNVELYSAKILDGKNVAPISRVVEGIYWAIDKKVNIINLSFGTSENSQALYTAIRAAYDAGILVVASAGNAGTASGEKSTVEYPAAYDEVVAVGAVGSDGLVTSESSTGEEVELVAPGEAITSTGGFGTEIVCSGTSMAVPHVVGLASLLWQQDPSMPASFIRTVLDASANAYGDEHTYGYGLIDGAYAQTTYETYRDNYKNGTLEGGSYITQKNDSMVEVFPEVAARWGSEDHEDFAGELAVIKEGAIYPDKAIALDTMTANPGFHGKGNFVAYSIYLSHIAVTGVVKEASEFKMINMGMNDFVPDNDLNQLNEVAVKNTINSYTGTNRNNFLWGIAIYNATDAYAHNSYVYFPYHGKYLKMIHGTKVDGAYTSGALTNEGVTGADYKYISIARWFSAEKTAEKMLACRSSGKACTYEIYCHDRYDDFINLKPNIYYPAEYYQFKLDKLWNYATSTIATAITGTNATILKNATY